MIFCAVISCSHAHDNATLTLQFRVVPGDSAMLIDIPAEATTADLRRVIANTSCIVQPFMMSFGGQIIDDLEQDISLADLSICPESEIEVSIAPHFVQMKMFLDSLDGNSDTFWRLKANIDDAYRHFLADGTVTNVNTSVYFGYDQGYDIDEDGSVTALQIYGMDIHGCLDLTHLPSSCRELNCELNSLSSIRLGDVALLRLERLNLNRNKLRGDINSVLAPMSQLPWLRQLLARGNEMSGTFNYRFWSMVCKVNVNSGNQGEGHNAGYNDFRGDDALAHGSVMCALYASYFNRDF